MTLRFFLVALAFTCTVEGRRRFYRDIGTPAQHHSLQKDRSAKVKLVEANDSGVSGTLYLRQRFGTVVIFGMVHGLKPGMHGFHIHAEGSTGNNCLDAKGNFNPFNKTHGAPYASERQVGDLGNIFTMNEEYPTMVRISDKTISLDENSEAYIGSKSIVIYSGEDDMGRGGDENSLKNGNVGSRLACGVIDTGMRASSVRRLSFKNDRMAKVELVEANDSGVSGTLYLKQSLSNVVVFGFVRGLKAGMHGFHIHAVGSTGNNCLDAKGHFNPFNKTHGAPYAIERHVGDLGNIFTISEDKITKVRISDKIISLDKNSKTYIGSKSLVLHSGKDDMGKGGDEGSLKTGNAGSRLACGVIEEIEDYSGLTFF